MCVVKAPTRPNARQSLGQNFLCDDLAARRIASALPEEGEGGSRVIELGPGQGALTRPLLERFPQMSAVEIDQRMEAVLRRELPALHLEHGDMLKLDFAALATQRGGGLSLVSNTPFYLTSQILFKILASVEDIECAVVTTQLEVADKLLSRPNCKDYGILPVMLQLFGRPEHLFTIPASAFQPRPKCEVAVLRLRPTAVPAGGADALTPPQRAQLLAVLKRAFENRRKMLGKTLKPLVAEAASPPPPEWLRKRPEQLEPSEFVQLATMLFGADPDGGGEAALVRHHATATWRPWKAGYVPVPPKRGGDGGGGGDQALS